MPTGVVFEKDEKKTEVLCDQRPGWCVYEADSISAIEAGIGFHLRPNFFDIDPYGQCWEVVDAVLSHTREPKIVLAVNDGLRHKTKIGAGWSCRSMEDALNEFGNDALYEKYLDVCKWLVKKKAGEAGYRLARWTGYHCGHNQTMTHFAAVLEAA